jgi:hypothetical protein
MFVKSLNFSYESFLFKLILGLVGHVNLLCSEFAETCAVHQNHTLINSKPIGVNSRIVTSFPFNNFNQNIMSPPDLNLTK